ncbi:MAG TPA: hypothetical protein VH988_27620 [Thermoanaerobaculia bacterium]|nr:hypothetical protein [Thermoanaerobaculia bacterium]
MDEPYPPNLPVVGACRLCNEGFSADEEYVACLIDSVIGGSATPASVGREKVRRILSQKPALTARLAGAYREVDRTGRFGVEVDRVRNVVLKLARGHALFELNEPQFRPPEHVRFVPLSLLARNIRDRFEQPPEGSLWPEIGSRAMQRLVAAPDNQPEWVIVQAGRYRYLASADHDVVVRMVLSEYLACEVVWRGLPPSV